MKEFLKKYEIWVFLVISPIINIFFVKARVNGLMSSTIYNTGRFIILLILLVILLKITRGNKGIIGLFTPMTKWKVPTKWFALSFLFALTVATTTLFLKSLYLDVEFSSVFNFNSTSLRGYIALLVWAFLGEVVWVSYCIRELSKKIKPFYAGLIVAIFWALWFIPIAQLGEGIFPKIPVPSLFICIIGIAGMCTFIYKNTKSGLCVLLLQYMLNISTASLPVTPTNGGAGTYTTFAIIYVIFMLILVFGTYFTDKKAFSEYV